MRMARAGALCTSLLFLLDAVSAGACSAAVKPLKQVLQESDTVLRVKVTGARESRGNRIGTVTLEVLEVLKGRLDSGELSIRGRLRNYEGTKGRTAPYDQLDCVRAAGCGGCFAYDYKAGAQYILMLKDGGAYWAPLSPTNEEVTGENDPWALWLKQQLNRTT